MASQDESGARGESVTAQDAAAWTTQVTAAWAEGALGWERLAAAWGTAPGEAPARPGVRCWWDGAPWHGRIAAEEFRAIVAAYVERYGAYTPDLPEREPELLHAWCRQRTTPSPQAAA